MPSSSAASLTDRCAFALLIVLVYSPGAGRGDSSIERYREDVFLHLGRVSHRDAGVYVVVLRKRLDGYEVVRGLASLPALGPKRECVGLFFGNLSYSYNAVLCAVQQLHRFWTPQHFVGDSINGHDPAAFLDSHERTTSYCYMSLVKPLEIHLAGLFSLVLLPG
jgi:hypothetical protein